LINFNRCVKDSELLSIDLTILHGIDIEKTYRTVDEIIKLETEIVELSTYVSKLSTTDKGIKEWNEQLCITNSDIEKSIDAYIIELESSKLCPICGKELKTEDISHYEKELRGIGK
jgi:DNA repair exonuclease SbcCD ATPase subunit